MNRREVISGGLRGVITGGCVALAGCSTDGGGDNGAQDAGGDSTDSGADDTATALDESPTGTTGDELDLREANVTEVSVSARSDSEYRLDVTLHHDDDGEDGYANWWQVETRDGERLGRRDLAHAHGTREFTRSETVAVPADVDCVVVRGHDQAHGYGGRGALVRVSTGATRFVDQGPARASMADADCP
jgi:hypothetical protein